MLTRVKKLLHCRHILTCFCFAGLSGGVALGNGPEVGRVLNTWREQQARFETVKFRISGTVATSADMVRISAARYVRGRNDRIPLPEKPNEHDLSGLLLFDLARGRTRIERVDQENGRTPTGEDVWYPLTETAIFTGKEHKFYSPRETNPERWDRSDGKLVELQIDEKAKKQFFRIEHNPLLFACGAIYFTIAIDADVLKVDLDPAKILLRGKALHEETPCLILQTVPDEKKRFFEYWVDAADPRRILRYNGYGLTGDGKLWLSTDIAYRDTEHGPIPDHWTATKYSFMTGKPQVYEIKLDEFDPNPPVTDADFDIDPPPGTHVVDSTLPRDAQQYVIAEPGKPDLPLGEHILQQEAARSRYWMYLGILAVVGIVAGAVFLVNRRS